MRSQEEGRRRMPPGNNLKRVLGCGSHNALGPTLANQRSDLSKGKSKAALIGQLDPNSQGNPPGTMINFRQTKRDQNIQMTQKISKDTVLLRAGKTSSVLQPYDTVQNAGSSRNMLLNRPKKNVSDFQSERSLSRKRPSTDGRLKKGYTIEVKPKNKDPEDAELECEEEIELKPMMRQRTSKKQLLRDPSTKSLRAGVRGADELIREFQREEEQLRNEGHGEVIARTEGRQVRYGVDPSYIERRQKRHFNWTMRAILMEWMMHISYEFRLKRETAHIALTLVDCYLQQTSDLPKSDFQLAGAAAVFIAAKLEEFEPLSSQQFSIATKERYKPAEIREMELRICQELGFQLNPPTLNMWANQIMLQWDAYLDGSDTLQHSFFIYHPPKYFKRLDEDSYRHYRQAMQLLDCALLDVQTLQYTPRVLVCSLLFLVLGKQFGEFNKRQITQEFPRTSRFLLEESPFLQVFQQFIGDRFRLEMSELLPSAQYMASYFILPVSYDPPCLRPEDENAEQMHWEEYCSYQTYNPDLLGAVKKRYRGIY